MKLPLTGVPRVPGAPVGPAGPDSPWEDNKSISTSSVLAIRPQLSDYGGKPGNYAIITPQVLCRETIP